MLTAFGRTARDYRLRHGWLLYDMAKVFRLGTAQLSEYEHGRKEPPQDVIDALDALIQCESKKPDKEANPDAIRKAMEEIMEEILRG